MEFLDICDDVLLEILVLIDPEDLLNISIVCRRLRDLAEGVINKALLNLPLTGINCFPHLQLQSVEDSDRVNKNWFDVLKHSLAINFFPNLKPRPFDNLERVRVHKNWLQPKFATKKLFSSKNFSSSWRGTHLDKHFYIAANGVIRKYDRLWNGKYLSSEFKVIGEESNKIKMFAKKDNSILAGSEDGTLIIYEDEEQVLITPDAFKFLLRDLDLFPKNEIYVSAVDFRVKIWSRKDNELEFVDKFSGRTNGVKIDPSGEKVAAGMTLREHEYVNLYDFNTQTKTKFFNLRGVWDLVWKDNQTLMTGHENGALRVFDLRTQKVCQKINPLKADQNVSIQYDGQNTVLCGFSRSKTVNICDLRMKKIVLELETSKTKKTDVQLKQIVADPKHLFVITNKKLNVCDFSV